MKMEKIQWCIGSKVMEISHFYFPPIFMVFLNKFITFCYYGGLPQFFQCKTKYI